MIINKSNRIKIEYEKSKHELKSHKFWWQRSPLSLWRCRRRRSLACFLFYCDRVQFLWIVKFVRIPRHKRCEQLWDTAQRNFLTRSTFLVSFLLTFRSTVACTDTHNCQFHFTITCAPTEIHLCSHTCWGIQFAICHLYFAINSMALTHFNCAPNSPYSQFQHTRWSSRGGFYYFLVRILQMLLCANKLI